MVSPRAVNFPIVLALLLSASAIAQAPPFEKARDAFKEGVRKPKLDDRLAAMKDLVETKDVRGVDELIASIRAVDNVIIKKREELDRLGKEHREVWKQLDDYIALKRKEEAKKEEKEREAKGAKEGDEAPDRLNPPPMTAPAELINRVEAKGKEVQEKLKTATEEMKEIEATRAALTEAVGRLLGAADPAARAPKILELAAAAQRAQSVDEKSFFIRLFSVIRTPESRDALIELGRLNTDARVRTTAIAALGSLQDPSAVPTLTEALKDDALSVRLAAAQSLAVLPSIDGVPALAEALGKNDGAASDAIIRALEDITGVTFFDNGTLWENWFKTEGTDIKAALTNLESGEPSVRMGGMTTIGGKGTLAGVRKILQLEGLDPPRDIRTQVKTSALGAPESRPGAPDELDARRTAIAKALQSRPKQIRERAVSALLLEPLARANAFEDELLQERYLRAAGAISIKDVLDRVKRFADEPGQSKSDDNANAGPPLKAFPESVRRAAVEALGLQDHDDAVDVVARVLRADKSSKQLKEACIASLVKLRREACVRALFEALLDKNVAAAAVQGLKDLTKEDFGADREKWTSWWNDKGKTATALSGRKTPEEAREQEQAEERKGGTTFYGITTRSKRLVYVLDMSGSMVIGEIATKGATGGGAGAHSKFWVAKKELKSSIASLPDDAMFDIIVFADGVKTWKPQLVTATKEVKAEALKWIENPKEVIAVGATNICDALERAFELAGRGTIDKRYILNVDTIMFMSDGQANRGRLIDPAAIIANISRLNENKKVTINTIGVGKDHDVELMKRLARLNGGTYVARQ